MPGDRQSRKIAANAADAAAEKYDQDGFHLFLMIQDFLQVYQPVAFNADDPDGGSIILITVGVRIRRY